MKKTVKRISQFFESRPRTDYMFVAIALAIFGFFAFWNISGPSIWFDEAFGAYMIHFNFIDIARYTATDVHPPFFYWSLKIWTHFFGHTELGLRSMSVFYGAIAAVFGWLLTRRQFGRKAAIVGLFILSISPLFIRYSQEARMYTMAAAIVLAATYVLVRAVASDNRKTWLLYGVLVAFGMWTHYFTALAWLAHWAWRLIVKHNEGLRGKALRRAFFDKNWLNAYILAVVLFLPWLPAMVIQLTVIQANGFWIGPVGVDTVGTYFGTLVYYLEHDHVTGWASAGLIGMGVLTAVLTFRNFKKGNFTFRRNYLLLFCLAAVPPILLFIISLPPATSSFVERYVLPAAAASAFFMGVTLVYGLKGVRFWKQAIIYIIILVMLGYGLKNIYFYGNYNKNSRTDILTKQLVMDAVKHSDPGEPIITSSPWTFYEAVFYNTAEHPIYFINAQTNYQFGSLDMLKYSNDHKILDLTAFTKAHPKVWYIGYAAGDIGSPAKNWVPINKISETSKIDGSTYYKGIEYTIPSTN